MRILTRVMTNDAVACSLCSRGGRGVRSYTSNQNSQGRNGFCFFPARPKLLPFSRATIHTWSSIGGIYRISRRTSHLISSRSLQSSVGSFRLARDIVLSCCSHDHRKNYELYVAAGHAGSRTHDLGAASRRESTRNSFLERDYANDQECLCTPDQPAAESPRGCLARGVIRSCAAVVGESRR